MREQWTQLGAGARHRMWIGGEWREALSGRTMEVASPATGESLGSVPLASAEDIRTAVEAGYRAFPEWHRSGPQARARCLRSLAERLRSRAQELARIDAMDSGNPIRSMRDDALRACEGLEYMAAIGLELKGESVAKEGSFHWTAPEPFGVVGRIIPFNHPILFADGKIAAPLMAGNTVILKPADQTPLSALAQVPEGVLPTGVLNVVTGDGAETGAALVRDPGVRRIAFTGSARLLAGGQKPPGAKFEKGYFLCPTVFDGVRPEMKIAREEIFGPVLSILTWKDYDTLLREINGLIYGLTASVWTRNAATALKAARDIQAGYVWINDSSHHHLGMPFGGYKQSGIGREESLAELLSYTQTKSVHMSLAQGWDLPGN